MDALPLIALFFSSLSLIMNVIILQLRRRDRTQFIDNTGRCLCCDRRFGRMFGRVMPHETDYAGGIACFPLCEGCWTELGSPEARLRYYRNLWSLWQNGRYSSGVSPDPVLWDMIETAVRDGR